MTKDEHIPMPELREDQPLADPPAIPPLLDESQIPQGLRSWLTDAQDADDEQPRQPLNWAVSADPTTCERERLYGFVNTLNEDVTKRGVDTIESYIDLAKKERVADAQPLVEQYLNRRLQQHLHHLEQVVEQGVHGLLRSDEVSEEETGGKEE